MTAPSPRPYRDLSDALLEAKRKHLITEYLAPIEAEQRHRKLERAAKEGEGA